MQVHSGASQWVDFELGRARLGWQEVGGGGGCGPRPQRGKEGLSHHQSLQETVLWLQWTKMCLGTSVTAGEVGGAGRM